MSGTPITIQPSALLFDMDGTLIDSSPAVVVAWETMHKTYPFLDLPHILRSAHGYRTTDALRKWCLIEDETLLASEVVRFEEAILAAAKEKGAADGQEGWAICTSSTFFYASQAIPTAGLPTPKIFVTAESVTRGKPFPDPYLLGAEKSLAPAPQCIVVEDAPTGIRSGKAAGCIVLATCTSHTRASLEAEKPDFLVEDLSHVSAQWIDGVLTISISQPIDRPSPAPTPLQTPISSRSGSPKLRSAQFAMSSTVPDESHFAANTAGAKGGKGSGMEAL